MAKNIYLDYASTTPADKRVVAAMAPYWDKYYGNPSSLYRLGLKSQQAIANSRHAIAKIINCQPEEIVFTGGGTESINLAIKGSVLAKKEKIHIITSMIEHPAVLNACSRLNSLGHELSFLPVDQYGLINLKDIQAAIQDNTALLSIIMANNEIGTIEPIAEIGAYLAKLNKQREKQDLSKIYFHSDACQAAGLLPIDVQKLHVDMLTINGGKIYGPKGIGLLYIKKGTLITPLIDGGGQENNRRSGTENVPAIVGLAKALELADKEKNKEAKRLAGLRDWLIKEISQKIDKTILNGHPEKRLPNNVNISIMDIEGEALLLYLDEIGIQASTGSACTSNSLEPSHVIRALGCPYEMAHGSLRLTLGKYTRKEDLKYLMKHLPVIVKKLRQVSPVKVNLKKVKESIAKAERKIIKV
ncbi:MAG: aminotransferase class V-fold PLP-dependent enzyme [Patescibacteria group bacterium]|nr:aminotransferase class V-fold PLP-dependent enzyme [Patescibacteria group bacterium]